MRQSVRFRARLLRVTAGFAFMLIPTLAQANVYRCQVKTVQQLSPSGTLNETDWTKLLLKNRSTVLWDDAEGLLRFVDSAASREKPSRFDFVQRGTAENSTIAVHVLRGSASTHVSLFQLQTFVPALPFMISESGTVWTGNCDLLK